MGLHGAFSMHAPMKYVEKGLAVTANGLWHVFNTANNIKQNPSFTPRWSDKPPTVKQIEDYVEVEVAWEGEHSEIAVFILTVKIDEKIVSMTRMRIRAREQSL